MIISQSVIKAAKTIPLFIFRRPFLRLRPPDDSDVSDDSDP